MTRIVKDAAVWEDMEGCTRVHKQINSLLTIAFISRCGIPSDECVSYAQPLIDMWNKNSETFVGNATPYLDKWFCAQEPCPRELCPSLPHLPRIAQDLADLLSAEIQ